MCSCACSQAKYRMSCMVNIWWWFTRLNFWMKFMSVREILVMFVCDMPMFVGQTFVGEISYIYIYVWGWVKTYHYHGRVSTSWTFMNQLCKGSRVPRFWPIASQPYFTGAVKCHPTRGLRPQVARLAAEAAQQAVMGFGLPYCEAELVVFPVTGRYWCVAVWNQGGKGDDSWQWIWYVIYIY